MTTPLPQPAIVPRSTTAGINRALFVASLMGGVAWFSRPELGADFHQYAIHYAAIAISLAAGLSGVAGLLKDYRLRRDLAASRRVSTDHGTARVSNAAERADRGMNDWRNGELYGVDEAGVAVFRPKDAPFALIEMPPGGGKTSALVVGSILHRAMLGGKPGNGPSVIVPDVKEELAVMLAPSLRKLGFEVWVINPARRHMAIVGGQEINPYQPFLDALYADDSARKDAVKLARDYAVLHHPLGKEEKNPYFSYGSQRAISQGLLSNGLTNPADCTPTALYMLLSDPARFLGACARSVNFVTVDGPDDVVEVARVEAKNLLHRSKKNEENFASFLEGASQKLIWANPSGHLGGYGANATVNLKDIRERQVIVFILTPLSHMREFGDFISLVNHNIVAAAKAKPSGHPIHIVAEEALNYRFQDLLSDLETMRQLRVTADFYIQSFEGLERHYGKEAAAAVESYADVHIYSGLNYARAKQVSQMLADATVRKQDFSYGASAKDVALSSREMARPVMTPDEVMAMPKGDAWMFVRGARPTKLKLVDYARVDPWTNWVGVSPVTGTRLHGHPIINIDYAEAGRVR